MPTPFTHLETAQRLLCDKALPMTYQAFLDSEGAAFLLGNVAADARNGGNMPRESTHFYTFDRPMEAHPWRVMLDRHSALKQAHTPAQAAFLAGYVAHLSIDEHWTLRMVRPRFVEHDWGADVPRYQRFFMLHILLTAMDERDLLLLQPWQAELLPMAAPDRWLPFMSDEILCQWRDFIAQQIAPGGESQTLHVFGERIRKTPAEMRAVLDSPEAMQNNLWRHVPRDYLANVEAEMYAFARQQLVAYLDEYGGRVIS